MSKKIEQVQLKRENGIEIMPKNTVYDVAMDYDSNAQPLANYLENLSSDLNTTANTANSTKSDLASYKTQVSNALDNKQQKGNYVVKDGSAVQCIQGGIVLGSSEATGISGTGAGRIMMTGNTNPVIGIQASNGATKYTPYYIQSVASDDKMFIGPTSTKALSFDKDGNMESPANLSIGGTITEGNVALSDKYAPKGHTHIINATASDDNVVNLEGTSSNNQDGTISVSYSASHANSGVGAGTYKSVTVNAKGHVTAGSNPTTLSGFGITDSYTKTEIDNKFEAIEWFQAGTTIASGSNLNNFTTPGKFQAGSEAIAKSLVNCPTKINFCMFVLVRTSGSSKTQLILDLNGKIYMRSCSSDGTWRTWKEQATTNDLDDALAAANDYADSAMEEAIEESKVVWFVYGAENTTYENITNALLQQKEVKILAQGDDGVTFWFNFLGDFGGVAIFVCAVGPYNMILGVAPDNEWIEESYDFTESLDNTRIYLENLIEANSTKLEDIEPGAEVNQNAFSSVFVNSQEYSAPSTESSLEFLPGSGISITGGSPGKNGDVNITIANTGATGVKGNAESTYRTGNVNITPANIGLGNVNNTADGDKPVSTKQQQAINTAVGNIKNYSGIHIYNNTNTLADLPDDGAGGLELIPSTNSSLLNIRSMNNLLTLDGAYVSDKNELQITVNADPAGAAADALAAAKTYAEGIKSDLLNGAGAAYDTLKELGLLIDENTDAIDALELVAAGKAEKEHTHNYAGSSSPGGAASSATKLATARNINGTAFDGSAAITTAKWGTSRTIGISSIAGTTGTAVDGSANANLIIPSTMTGFSSITSTNFVGSLTGNASSATNVAWSGVTSKPSYYDAKAIKGITRSGTTFTYTCMDGTTGTFTQQDNNTTYGAGTGLTLTGTTFSISSANASAIINLLGEGTSPAEQDDYIVAQYANGNALGNSTYYRRKVKNIVNAANVKAALGTGSGTSKYLREDGTWVAPPNTDTKNTAGSTQKSAKLFLIGAESQAANPTTYSNKAYVDANGNLYSNDSKVWTDSYAKEAYLTWGGKDFAGSWSPIDAAMISDLGANRLQFLPASAVTLEYSRDSGATWTAVDNETVKRHLFATSDSFVIGNDTGTKKDKSAYQCRVTITTTGQVYSALNKFVINVSTNGSSGCYCKIEARTKANQDSNTNTWVVFKEKADLSGWSGWNVINTNSLTTHGNRTDQYSQIRFTFGVTAHSSSVEYAGLAVRRIMAFGGMGWTTPSNMAATGHIYTHDSSQNVTFPGQVTATSFSGTFRGNASTATKLLNARGIQTDLSSTASQNFDGTASIYPGVKGTLGIGNGGTNATTAAGARTNLDVYSKSEVDTKLGTKSSSTHIHKASYTPAGSVSQPTFSGSKVTSEKPSSNTATINSISSVGTLPTASLSQGTSPSHSYTAPSLTATVTGKCLKFTFNVGEHSFNKGSLPSLTFTAGSLPQYQAVTVPNTEHTHQVTAAGTVSKPSFTGQNAEITVGAPQ